MGIMRLKKTLMDKYTLIKKRIRNSSDISLIDYLFFDLNEIIHEISHSKTENILYLLKEKDDEEIYSKICEYIKQTIEFINPKNIMIALDGVSPMAKINGQLCSRAIKGAEKCKEIQEFMAYFNVRELYYFDQNKISPCTDFMINLEEYLKKYFNENSSLWLDKKIIISGSNIPGEAENKIMEKIREVKENINDYSSKKYCIISNDSDCILYSLLTHEPNIVLLTRNPDNYNYDFEFRNDNNLLFNEAIFISCLREYLENEFLQIKTSSNFIFNKERFYDDFVLLCLLLGTDFLPEIMTLDQYGEVYNMILESYKNYIIKNENYLTKNGRINFSRYIDFIKELCLYEEDFIINKFDILKSRWNNKNFYKCSTLKEIYDNKYNNTMNLQNLKNLMNSDKAFPKKINNVIEQEMLSKDKEYKTNFENLNFTKFVNIYKKNKYEGKKFYYNNKFHLNIEEDAGKINKIILNYLEGLQWILLYYKGFTNWNWNYYFKYSPFLSDIAEFDCKEELEKIYDNISREKGEPLSPYIYQSLIFNNNSFDLIPKNYNSIKTIIKEYYSNEIEIDNNGFYFLSHMVFNFPLINKETIEKLIEFDKKELKNTKNYNIIKNQEEFYFNTNKNYRRKNEIFNEDYIIKNTDEMFASIKNIKNITFLENEKTIELKKINKEIIMKTNSIKLHFNYTDINIKEDINEIFNSKIISYGYPSINLGVVNGIYCKDKYYSIDQDTRIINDIYYDGKYNENIKKNYENIGIIINQISYLIHVIPIKKIDMNNNDIFEFDYDYNYLIPLEITSLNKENENHNNYLKKIFENNNIKFKSFNEINIDIDKEKLKKNNIFYFEKIIKNKKNRIKEESSIKNKGKFKKNKNNKKKQLPQNKMSKNERKKNMMNINLILDQIGMCT